MEHYVYEETFVAKYFSIRGRLDRLPYALRTTLVFMVYNIVITILGLIGGTAMAGMMMSASMGMGVRGGGALGALIILLIFVLTIVLVIVFMMLAVRRFHDLNKSGYLAWLFIAPILWAILAGLIHPIFNILFFLNCIVNIVLYFYLIFKQGSYGTNNFGPDPLFETSLRYCENPNSIPREF